MRPPNGVILHEIYEYPQFPYSHRTSGAEEVLAASAADEAVTSCVAAQRNIKLVKTMNCVTVIVSRVSATIARCGDHRSPCNIYLLINSAAITTIPPANKHRSRRNVIPKYQHNGSQTTFVGMIIALELYLLTAI